MALYAVSEGVAAALGMQLWTMSRRGEDLSQAGLTAYVSMYHTNKYSYMFDVIYITWFVHITTALLSRYFWWTFALVRGDEADPLRSPCMRCISFMPRFWSHLCYGVDV